jgi:hypothetical protein
MEQADKIHKYAGLIPVQRIWHTSYLQKIPIKKIHAEYTVELVYNVIKGTEYFMSL